MNIAKKSEVELLNAIQTRDFVLKSAQIGTWEWNLKTQTLRLNEEFYEIIHAPT